MYNVTKKLTEQTVMILTSNVFIIDSSTIQSSCLVDEPQAVAELKFPDKLPGEIFDADIQCQWQFGKHASLCIFEFGKVCVLEMTMVHRTMHCISGNFCPSFNFHLSHPRHCG